MAKESDLPRMNKYAIWIVFLICVFSGCEKTPSKPMVKDSDVQAGDVQGNLEVSRPVVQQLVSSRYVPDRQCADCHEEIWKSYQHVGMSKSAYAFDANEVIEDFENAHFYHQASQKHYEMAIEDENFVMTRYRLGENGERTNVHRQAADFVIGSGNHSRTYAYRDASGSMFQLPVVWYSQDRKWGMAPGYDNAQHDDFTRPITRECMFCHNAYPASEPEAEKFLAPARFPKSLPHGIGCQRCHGPGQEHVKAAEKDAQAPNVLTTIVNPANLSDQLRDDVCNQCHLQPTSARTSFLRHFERGAYSFRPGERLADFQSYVELSDAAESDLFEVNHHSYRMQQSKCYTASDGAMSCVSCHNPHASVAAEDRVAHYREKCFQCHGNDDCLDVEHGRQADSDCVKCHMPGRRAEDAIHVVMTDHKIDRPSGRQDLLAILKETTRSSDYPVKDYPWLRAEGQPDETTQKVSKSIMRVIDKDSSAPRLLASQISNGDTKADESKAVLAQAFLEIGNSAEALQLLNGISGQGKRNSSIQANIGLGLIQEKKFALAAKFLEKAIALEPVVPEAHFNLGIAYISSGRIDEAIEQFRAATELQPNLANPRFYLGAALARKEQYDLAEKEFRQVLQIDPDQPGGGLSLAGVQRLQGKRVEAIATLESELNFRPTDVAVAEDLALSAIESVEASEVAPRKSLDAAKVLYKLTQKERNSRLIVAVALLQNGFNEKALEAVGSVKSTDSSVNRLLIAAIVKAKLDQSEESQKLYRSGMLKLKKRPEPRTRLQETIVKLAEKTFGDGR